MKNSLITVCGASGCKSLESLKIYEKLKEIVKKKKLEISVKRIGCHGLCEAGPIVVLKPEDILYKKVKIDDCEDIIKSIVDNRPINRLLYSEKDKDSFRYRKYVKDIGFYKHQTRYLLRRTGEIDPYSLQEYLDTDGYEGLCNALSKTPQEVIQIIKDSGLRGRGGGGFPTGMKWEFLSKAKGEEKYLIVNADEGDPGSFMDRTLMEGDPFSLIEGLTIAAYATGVKLAYIYVRAEYPDSVEMLKNAIKLAKKSGYLGKNILKHKGFDFDIKIFLGAGAFVCGEETALMNSIEGLRGMPRPKPPFPAQSGIFNKPSNINNVKSYAYTSHILRDGIESFKKYGTEKSPGTAVLSLTGKIRHTGIVEVPMGTSLKDLIYKIGNGIQENKKLKAVLTGGPSGGAIPVNMLNHTVDYESITKAGSIMGSGGVLVIDEDDSMVKLADFFIQFCMAESCGKCTPCREGTLRLHEILTKIIDGKGKQEDIDILETLSTFIKDNALCGLGQTAPNPILTTLKYFRNEYDVLIDKKSKVYYKVNEGCISCGVCAKNCPVQCITGKPKEKYFIHKEKCIACGLCAKNCPVKCITRETN